MVRGAQAGFYPSSGVRSINSVIPPPRLCVSLFFRVVAIMQVSLDALEVYR